MNKKVTLLAAPALMASVLLATMLAAPQSSAQLADGDGATHIAVCDIVEVFNNYEKAQVLTAEFEARRERIDQQSEARAMAIEEKQKELANYREDSDEFERQFKELQHMVVDAQVWVEYEESLARRDHLKLTTEMYQEILATIENIAEEQGYDIVLFREAAAIEAENTQQLLRLMQDRKVLYSSNDADITAQVLSRVNTAYRAD